MRSPLRRTRFWIGAVLVAFGSQIMASRDRKAYFTLVAERIEEMP